MSNYLDALEADLRAQGVNAPNSISPNSMNSDDTDLKIILDMQRELGIEYSEEQKAILRHRGSSVILACAGSGKALVNGTLVLTKNGWRPIEKLNIGDIVYDHAGDEQVVIGVFPQGKKVVYNVRFNTGDIIKCCGDHLWTVRGNNEQYWIILNTCEMSKLIEETGSFDLPNDLDIYDGSYKRKCSRSYFEVVLKNVVGILKLGHIIEEYESDNKEITKRLKLVKNRQGITAVYDFCLSDAYKYAKSEELKKVLKEAYEYFGMSTCYEDGEQVDRKIVSIEKTEEYADMTCIKVTGMTELFLTEHCIPTHNTTITTHLIAKRIKSGEIQDPNKIVYITYSKAGATEMKLRMDKVMRQLGYRTNINVRTLHSFFNKLIKDFGTNKKILSEHSKYKMVAESCKESGFTPKEDDVEMIINLMSYQINNLLGDKKAFECIHNTIEGLTLEQYVDIRKAYIKKKLAIDSIDFDDMEYYIYMWTVAWGKSDNPDARAYNKAVLDYCKACFTDFYIDEAQDVGKIQFEILKALVTEQTNPNKLTANFTFIGDDDQAIYSWRGSDPSIIQSAGPHFNIKNLVLSTNYRCKNEIVDFATIGIKCNNTRYEKSMNAHKMGGTVKIRVVTDSENNLYTMSKLSLQQIQAWISEGQKPEDIAVLCRNNKHLSVLSILLLNNGIFYDGTEEMRATKGLDYSDLKMIIDMCEGCWKSDIPNRLFWKFNRYIKKTVYLAISKLMSEAGLSIEDALWYVCKRILNKPDITEEKTIQVGFEADKKINYAINMVGRGNTNLETLCSLYKAMRLPTREERFKTLAALYKTGIEEINGSLDSKRITRTLFSFAVDISDQQGFDAMKNFLKITEQFESGTVGVLGGKITLSTVHSAKGREWKNVIMFASDNISEPSFGRIRELNDSDKTTPEDLYNYIDEERRLFYVGCTRAKENLVLMTSMQPSVFILDSLGIDIKNQDIINYSLQGSYGNEFKDEINEKIISKSSKYSVNK